MAKRTCRKYRLPVASKTPDTIRFNFSTEASELNLGRFAPSLTNNGHKVFGEEQIGTQVSRSFVVAISEESVG